MPNAIVRLGKNKMVKILIGIAVGAIVGFLYYRFIGCASGTCKIASNPYISTIYWALIGGFLASAL
jgi:uncharacterized protein DUF6132